MISRFALAASLALAVAACGSNDNQPTSQATTESVTTTTATAAPEAVPSEAAPSDTPSAEASATPSPTPTPSPKASASGAPKMSDAATGAASGPPQAFNQCTACHSTTPGKTIIGPSLAHVYGRKAGSVAGFQYSDAMKSSGLAWNAGNLDAFLANPAGKVPGTLMGLAGIKDAAQRKAIIDYLKTL
jgi:cytochrome c